MTQEKYVTKYNTMLRHEDHQFGDKSCFPVIIIRLRQETMLLGNSFPQNIARNLSALTLVDSH